jgi:hypothetical protein
VAQFGALSFVRSVQRGTIAVAAAALTGTATITTVGLTNSLLVFNGSQSDNSLDAMNKALTRVELTNATTVTATRNTVGEIQTVSYEVIEFWPGVIKQVQRGTITMTTASSATATIDGVTMAKALVEALGFSQTNIDGASVILSRLTLTNSTTVTANRTTGTGNVTIGYQVVEFY